MTTGQESVKAEEEAPPESLWRNGDFLKFWFGETLSLYGTQVTSLALPLTAILAFNATEEQVGLLRFLQLAPYLGLALIFGVWIDRVRRKPGMIAANAARLVLIALVPILYWADMLAMAPLLVIACAIGIASVWYDLSWMSYVTTVVKEPRQYVEASSKMGISSSSADVVGPGLAGGLVSLLTAPVALVVDAFSYLASLVSLLLIRKPEAAPKPSTVERHLGRELKEGVGFVFKHPILRPLAIVAPFCNFSLVTVWTMFLLYAAKDLKLNATIIGVIFSAASIGGLVGATISRKVIDRFPIGPVYLVSMSMIFLSPLLIVFAQGGTLVRSAFFVLSFFISYLGLGVAGVVMVSLRQTCTPPSLMGRMSAAFRTMLFGGGSLGGLFAGLLAGGIGAKPALVWAAAGSAAVVIGLLVSPVSRLRELPPAAKEAEAAS
ncbi:MFS transporter [Longispora albida]|uniref:MFS transporter n=1 Tax=Longispora albida TaxID=203523 RepID=UPI000372F832|nr:MFS transporter [Longispora albida]